MEKLDIRDIKQFKSEIKNVRIDGCNVSCMAMILEYELDRRIYLDDFYNELLAKKIITRECYINDYHDIFKLYGFDDIRYVRKYNFTYSEILDSIMLSRPVKARCTTNPETESTHFSLIVGYEQKDGILIFNVNDPMDRDSYIDSDTWEFFSIIKGKRINSGRHLDRIEIFYTQR